ncbi:hypothetical protein [Marisediminicola sp. LYQ85]|uniref:hypothetical protein n=1 Tax=Marisediminicola sp. LYQ85 TaxID=3391062 RepID=UPI003983A1DE
MITVKSGAPADEALKVVAVAYGDAGALKALDRPKQSSVFTDTTRRKLRAGRKHLSMGVLAGFRIPMAHKELAALKAKGVFAHQDCLDALRIPAHLPRRLDDSAPRPPFVGVSVTAESILIGCPIADATFRAMPMSAERVSGRGLED